MKKLVSGKVRDIYEVSGSEVLIVASDRISAFDVILNEPIPKKGYVLTACTQKWSDALKDIVDNHFISAKPVDWPVEAANDEGLIGRAFLAKKAKILPFELIVRGYLAGSAFKEYVETGTVHKEKLRSGMQLAEKFDTPLFTPSTKAPMGQHDQNLSWQEFKDALGESQANILKDLAIRIYALAHQVLKAKGLVLADTKFEIGICEGQYMLCDEYLTPDSSRIWEEASIEIGKSPESFDKQPVRDYLNSLNWNKLPPPPNLPDLVVRQTTMRYVNFFERVFETSLDNWLKGLRS